MPRARRPFQPPLQGARDLGRLVTGAAVSATTRRLQEFTRRGEHGGPIQTGPDRTVLLFFEDVDRDTLLPNDRHLRRAARRVYHALTIGRRVSGFEVSFNLLCRALRRAGCRVVVNNVALARRNPRHPVGLCGYPHILERWRLPNPAVLGPGFFDHPAQAPHLMEDHRFRAYLVHCEWMRELFAPVYGRERCVVWPTGLDVDASPDHRSQPKDLDLLVYEKILWRRDETMPRLLDPLLAELKRRGLRTTVLHYGKYLQQDYLALLARARGMVYLCEHETQGIACQEALVRNVPVLAWDQGWWLDPIRHRYSDRPVAASSVPYFSPACGERFADAARFPAALDRFLSNVDVYEPRRFVRDHLSLEASADAYLAAYVAAGIDRTRPASAA